MGSPKQILLVAVGALSLGGSSQQRPGPCAGRAEGGRRGLAGIFQLIPFAFPRQTLILLTLGVGGLVLPWGNNATLLSLGFPICTPAIVATVKPLAPNNVKRGSTTWLGSFPMGSRHLISVSVLHCGF